MTNEIFKAQFVQSAVDYRKCPPPLFPEYAFLGRSNVGKSSLINMLTNRKHLAKISVTPGKTRLVNHFLMNDSWYLVDLPGYGYAKTNKTLRETFTPLIMNYLLSRKNLLCTFLLIDTRLQPQSKDIQFMEWMAEKQLPFSILFTKTDKLTRGDLQASVMSYKEHLLQTWEELPPTFVTSSKTGTGREEILAFIANTNSIFDPQKTRY